MPLSATLHCADLSGNDLILEQAVFSEEINAPTRATVLIADMHGVTVDPADPVALIGKPATLKLTFASGLERKVPLVVTAVEHPELDTSDIRVRLELEHPLALLRLSADRRTFLQKSVKDIVTTVLAQVGLTPDWSASRGTTPLDACVQYGESDYDFFARLLEHEGIFWFCPDDASTPKITIADKTTAFTEVAGGDVNFSISQNAITELAVTHTVTSGAVALTDYDYEKPGVNLLSRAQLDDDAAGEIFEYPGGYGTQADGAALAKIRAEEVASTKTILSGKSVVTRFRAATTFTLVTDDGVALPTDSGKYLLRRVEHTYSLVPEAYTNTFVASPAELPYRPARRTPTPFADGTLTAVATGPKGQEIHTDKLGRAKFQYSFDRLGKNDDTSSQWIRVLQPAIGGSMMLARMGWELALRHLDGNPDRPLAIARMYDGEHPPPDPLPANMTKTSFDTLTSPNAEKRNAITIDDKENAMLFEVTAAKDLDATILHDEGETIGANDTLLVGKDSTTLIGGKQTTTVDKNDTAKALKDAGVAIKGDRTKKVTKDESSTIEGQVSVRVDGNDEETIGQNLTVGSDKEMVETAKGKFDLTVGASVTAKAKKDYTIYIAGKSTELVGAAKTVASSDGSLVEKVQGNASLTVGAAWVETVDGHRVSSSVGKMSRTVGAAAMLTAAGKLQLSGKTVKIVIAGAGTFIGGGGIVSLTPASIAMVGTVTLKGSGGVTLSGSPMIAT